VTESEIIRQASRRGQEHIKKNALRNSKEWQRRKMTMKKSKKWSTANLGNTAVTFIQKEDLLFRVLIIFSFKFRCRLRQWRKF